MYYYLLYIIPTLLCKAFILNSFTHLYIIGRQNPIFTFVIESRFYLSIISPVLFDILNNCLYNSLPEISVILPEFRNAGKK